MYFIYTLNELDDEPIVFIDKHIGIDPEDGMGIMGDQCAREIMALDSMGKKRIQVWINSVGGSVIDAMAIYNAILKSKTKVDTYNVGIAASSADLVFQAGRRRYMNDYALRMMHNPFYTGDDGNEDVKQMLDAFKSSACAMIAQRCGKDTEVVDEWMNATTWMNAATSLENNLCDEISASSDYNKKRMANVSDAKAMWTIAKQIVNKAIEDKKTIKMEKVLNHLKLNKEANEDALMDAIKGIENRASGAEKQLSEVQDKLTNAEAELKKVQDKVKEYEDAKTAAEKEAKTVKAKAFVADLVKAGKIKNEAAEAWEEKHVADPEGTEALADSLTSTKEASKIDLTQNNAKPALSVAAKMAEQREKYNI